MRSKIRAADAPIVETSQFLQLYCPLLLEHLQPDDLFVPKSSSSAAALAQVSRAFSAYSRQKHFSPYTERRSPSDQDLVERLTELGILADGGPRAIGIYLQCDSSLRDIENLRDLRWQS